MGKPSASVVTAQRLRVLYFPDSAHAATLRIAGIRMTPYEKLRSLPGASAFLKPGVSFGALDAYAAGTTDSQAAQLMNEARSRLFQSIQRRSIRLG